LKKYVCKTNKTAIPLIVVTLIVVGLEISVDELRREVEAVCGGRVDVGRLVSVEDVTVSLRGPINEKTYFVILILQNALISFKSTR
jgi:hypothetical protein